MEAGTTEIEAPNPNPNRNLNDLPAEILIHILTLIPTLEAIRTSLVSRQWRPLWSRLPCLDFPYDLFPVNNDAEPLPVTSHRFAELVDRALILRPHSPIKTFRLSFIFYHYYTSHVDSWIRCALTRFQARELHLDFFVQRQYHRRSQGDSAPRDLYEFRFSVLRESCVESLRLTNVDLALPASMCLGSVRSMFLEDVSLTDQMWELLIKGCPNLEDLELQNGLVEQNMRICSTSLKKLKFGYFYDCDDKNSLEIDCPNLVSLSFDNVSFTHFRLKNASSLVEFNLSIVHHVSRYYDLWSRTVKLLGSVPNVKRLNLQNWCFKLLTSQDSFPKTFMIRNLSLLELRTGYTQHDLVGMAALLELCPNLETLILDYLLKIEVDESLPEEISNKPVNLNIPRLKEVKMLKFFGSEDENKFVTLLKKHGVVLQKITLFPFKIDGNSCHQYPPVVLCRM
ncbi:PREDICTED: F-box/LRR-repeat protein At3g26922-like [Fragaria vesca subsp. vesca]|uniref:F-box/LRR-repeat protein At3g26922-like n=1 Tax=Fragaria vesca subsp. vesca TaxID=101020 RepID=UPI0002C311B0|nr:PREDICTED: F-box/LRR-repeat protein At3g26922-like [Fragaria vesca subsp. vesca]